MGYGNRQRPGILNEPQSVATMVNLCRKLPLPRAIYRRSRNPDTTRTAPVAMIVDFKLLFIILKTNANYVGVRCCFQAVAAC
jgi:hypothetical protein